MVPLVALVALRQDVIAERALREGTRVLAAFDVPSPYATDHVWANGDGSRTIDVTAKDGVRYRFRDYPTTDHLLVTRRDTDALPPRPGVVRDPAPQRTTAERGVERLRVPYATLHAHYVPSGYADYVGLPIAFHSYAFVGSNTYEYGIQLNAATGDLLMFSFPKALPDFDYARPVLSEADAVAAAKRIMPSDPPSKYDANRHLKPWDEYVVDLAHRPYGGFGDVTPHFGWFVPLRGGKARLAWAMPYHYETHTSHGTQGSLLTLMVDAATGERLPSPDEESRVKR